jgi:chromosome segregation ATPase
MTTRPEMKAHLLALVSHSTELAEYLDSTHAELDEFAAALKECNKWLSDAREERDRALAELSARQSELNKERGISELERSRALTACRDRDEVLRERDRALADLDVATKDLDRAVARSRRDRDNRDKAFVQRDDALAKRDMARESAADREAQRNECAKALKVARTELNAVGEERDAAVKELCRFSKEYEELNNELDKARVKISALVGLRDRTDHARDEERARHREQLAHVQLELSAVRDAARTAYAEIERLKCEAHMEVIQIKREWQDAIKERDAVVQGLTAQRHELRRWRDDAIRERDEACVKAQDLTRALARAHKELDDARHYIGFRDWDRMMQERKRYGCTRGQDES